ncbi:linear amide C-N hydrolase [Mangrovibacterium sp.]|uniref:linear amide C-N hydrolase n=1 Tax=Mangrovibacterium sp. TaxID=1961364 RepID=UPI0035612C7C
MKQRIQFILKITFAFVCLIVENTNVFSCSAFLMKGDNYCIVGFNENWKSMPGIVVSNKRNVVKRNLSWKHLVSKEKPSEPEMEWTSKYGSISFNLLGLDLPCYGVNEKGLFVVELFLDHTFTAKDSLKPNMFWAQWIQYQLDNYATVSEVIDGLQTTANIDWWPTFPGSHFFISDKDGNTAAIELIDGKYSISTGETMPIPILCNKKYQDELIQIKKFEPFGGTETLSLNPQSWENRFAKAAYHISNYDSSNNENPVSFAFSVLDRIKPGEWQVVADLKNDIVYFRSDQGQAIKKLCLSDCDFSPSATVKFIDINSNEQGNVFNSLLDLTVEINDDYVEKGFPIGYENTEFYNSNSYFYLKENLHSYIVDKLK